MGCMNLICLFTALGLSAATPYAIIGGGDQGFPLNPYAALVDGSGATTALTGSGLPVGMGVINSVAINSFGFSIIGGQDTNLLYAAFVDQSGITTKIGVPVTLGQIHSVSINNDQTAIIGGIDSGMGPGDAYAAIVTTSGLTQISLLPVTIGNIAAVSINQLGNAILGGGDNSNIYAAIYLASTGMAQTLTGAFPSGGGSIQSVAINESGNAIVGGIFGADAFAVTVDSTGAAKALTGSALPLAGGQINSVAINDSGNAIIGGYQNLSNDPYAALVSSEGVTSSLSGPALPVGVGAISSVAINRSGAAIIGGADHGNANPYAALISPTGFTTALSGFYPSTDSGVISAVAIGDSGAAIIGGHNATTSSTYVALVSPSGVATQLTGLALPSGNGFILSAAILKTLVEEIAPESFGPGNSFAGPLFALASNILPNHALSHHRQLTKAVSMNQELGFLADASDTIPALVCCKENRFSLWFDAFGNQAFQKEAHNIPDITNWMAGSILGFDYSGIQDVVLGLAAAYAFDYAHVGNGQGHAKFNEEFLTLYGSWSVNHFFLDVAIWGGLYQLRNERHTIGNITSTSNVDGWLLLPHLEMSFPLFAKCDWFLIDPFVMFDWANNWQGHIHEKGASGFNLVFGDQYMSILRSEAGLRFYETLKYRWGALILEEKASYVNKKPFQAGTVSTFFVGSASNFGVDMFSNQTENLGAVQFRAEFVPCNSAYPYGSINYQGEFGSPFRSNLLSFEIGKDF